MSVYFDCAATTPLDPRVGILMRRYLEEEFGNAGSRTHEFGRVARAAVEHAREQVAAATGASRGDVIFTSGATESNNLALLGLAGHGEAIGRRHVVSTAIEHHAVLEPLGELRRRGFEVTLVAPDEGGAVSADAIAAAVRRDTLAVSVMHVNNETGVRQPIAAIADALATGDVWLHVDAAQGFGKDPIPLRHPRIDLISVSAHKIHGPKGAGALIARRRGGRRPLLAPLLHGGGQERGLRPGTMPVHQIAGLGLAAELAAAECGARTARCVELRAQIIDMLRPLSAVINGDPDRALPHILNVAIPGLEAEAVIDRWEPFVAISQGAACTSQTYTCSHVLEAMRLPRWRQDGAVRLSWSHLTPVPDLAGMAAAVASRPNAVETPAR